MSSFTTCKHFGTDVMDEVISSVKVHIYSRMFMPSYFRWNRTTAYLGNHCFETSWIDYSRQVMFDVLIPSITTKKEFFVNFGTRSCDIPEQEAGGSLIAGVLLVGSPVVHCHFVIWRNAPLENRRANTIAVLGWQTTNTLVYNDFMPLIFEKCLRTFNHALQTW